MQHCYRLLKILLRLCAAGDREGSVRKVLQNPALVGGHGMLVMFDVTDLTKVARHDHEGWYEGIC
jgi:hypothetical protein